MNPFDFLSPLTQHQLSILENLSNSGPTRIHEKGTLLSNVLRQLRTENFGLSDEAKNWIENFMPSFRWSVREFKNYVLYNSTISSQPLQNQINALNDRFHILDAKMTELDNEVHNFISNQGLKIENGRLVRLSPHEIIGSILQPANSSETNSESIEGVTAPGSSEPNSESIEGVAAPGSSEPNSESIEGVIAPGSENTENIESVTDVSELTINSLVDRPILFQIGIPIPLNAHKILNSKSRIFSKQKNFITLQPELQMKYMKAENGNNQFFIGINCDLTLNFCNLKTAQNSPSHLVSFRSFNTIAKFSQFHAPNNSYFSLSVGQICKIQTKEVAVIANLKFKNTDFHKENLSFQFEYRSLPSILVSKQNLYSKFNPLVSYDVFPFVNTLKKNQFLGDGQADHKSIFEPDMLFNMEFDGPDDSLRKGAVTYELQCSDNLIKKNNNNQTASVGVPPIGQSTNLISNDFVRGPVLGFLASIVVLGVIYRIIRFFKKK